MVYLAAKVAEVVLEHLQIWTVMADTVPIMVQRWVMMGCLLVEQTGIRLGEEDSISLALVAMTEATLVRGLRWMLVLPIKEEPAWGHQGSLGLVQVFRAGRELPV